MMALRRYSARRGAPALNYHCGKAAAPDPAPDCLGHQAQRPLKRCHIALRCHRWQLWHCAELMQRLQWGKGLVKRLQAAGPQSCPQPGVQASPCCPVLPRPPAAAHPARRVPLPPGA